VNYFGLIRCAKAALPLFRRQFSQATDYRGRVINITSMAGLIAVPGMTAYSASKHAANVASHSLRMECKEFLDVVTVNPSYHSTPLLQELEKRFTKENFEKLAADLQAAYGMGKTHAAAAAKETNN